MAISSPGVGSNLDVNSIVTQLMALEQRPLTKLAQKEASFQARLSAFGALKGAISAFQTTLTSLQSLSKFETPAAKVADAAIFTASADSSAANGSYSINVTGRAAAHVLNTAGMTSPSATGSTGSISLRVGNGAARTITLTEGNNTLEGLRDAINTAQAGVSAVIINDGGSNPYRLVLTANASGLDNTIDITHTLSAGALKNAVDGISEARPARNAELTINGIAISRPTNSIKDAIPGVTLQLLEVGETSLTVGNDVSGIQASVQAFVKAYNDLNKTISGLTAYDAQTRTASILSGDISALSVQTQMRAALSSAIPGLGGSVSNLSQAGISFQPDGSLALDAAKLGGLLGTAPAEIGALFAPRGQTDSSLLVYQRSGKTSMPGPYQVHVTEAATRGAAAAGSAAATNTVINADNDGFQIRINGIASGTVRIAHGSYDAAGLAAALQAALDSSATLSAAGLVPAVSLSAGRLVISSPTYGIRSTVSSTGGTAAAALGYGGNESGAGRDVAGHFESAGIISAATGNGQELTANPGTPADGLTLRYTGTAAQLQPGLIGTAQLTEGYAMRLDRLAARLLDEAGPISSRTGGINRSIADIERQRDTINRRLASTEARIRAQFTALDTLVSRLSNTSNFLTQQLANLPGGSNSRN